MLYCVKPEKATMAVTCPKCEARFRDPPGDILETRKLQCGRCDHIWQSQRAGGRAEIAHSPGLAPGLDDLTGDEHSKPATGGKTSQPADGTATTLDGELQPLVVPAVLLACLMVLAAGVGLRTTVMQMIPQSAAIYQLAGLAPANPGLEIGKVVTTRVERDGIQQLIIQGQIQNVADNTVPVPPVRLTMRGKEDGERQAWTVAAAKSSLAAGESSRFTAVTSDFPTEMLELNVEFAPSGVQD